MQNATEIKRIYRQVSPKRLLPFCTFDSGHSSGFLDCGKSCTISPPRKLLFPSQEVWPPAPQLYSIAPPVAGSQGSGITFATFQSSRDYVLSIRLRDLVLFPSFFWEN